MTCQIFKLNCARLLKFSCFSYHDEAIYIPWWFFWKVFYCWKICRIRIHILTGPFHEKLHNIFFIYIDILFINQVSLVLYWISFHNYYLWIPFTLAIKRGFLMLFLSLKKLTVFRDQDHLSKEKPLYLFRICWLYRGTISLVPFVERKMKICTLPSPTVSLT